MTSQILISPTKEDRRMHEYQESVQKVLSGAREKIIRDQLLEAAKLLEPLKTDFSIEQELSMVLGRLNRLKRNEIQFGPGEYDQERSQCAWSLQQIVGLIEVETGSNLREQKTSVDPYRQIESRVTSPIKEEFRYACGRYEQTMIVDPFILNRPSVSFYLLHGENLQSHRGFLERIEKELKGSFLRRINREMKFEKYQIWCPDLKERLALVDKQELVAKTCKALHLDPDENYPLEDQKFGGLLREANPRSYLNEKDVIIFTIKINYKYWKRGGRKQLMEWLSASFFSEEWLTDDTPRILVFWSLTYHPWHRKKNDESDLKTALQELSVDITLLPELKPVEKDEVADWLEQIEVEESQIYELIQHIFGDKETIDMVNLEKELLKIIRSINEAYL